MPSRAVLAALAAASLFLAGSVGYAVGVRTATERPSRADVGFLTDMITHHEQAVELSKIALSRPMPEGVESFVLEVLSDQRYEIGLMEATLRGWDEPVSDDDGVVMGWMDHEVPDDEMPGLATPEQIDALSDATEPDDVARQWLALMTVHHQGGIHMADAGIARVSDPMVLGLAKRIARNQRIEINEYAAVKKRLGL
jgi:uncharacterized protein (DUF305 family)